MSTNIYYVYEYLREDGSPYYIGKGKGSRAWEEKYHTIKPPKDESRIHIIKENLSEEEAFSLEKELIKQYGRKDNGTGILRNMTDGGQGCSGRIYSDETRRKISEANKRRVYSEETKLKISNSVKKLWESEEYREAMSESMSKGHLGTTLSDETKNKLSEMNKGEKNPMYGKIPWNKKDKKAAPHE